MFKRFFLILLILAVACSILGFKLLSWNPAIIVSITGKNFLLNSPLAALVDVEKLYILPDNHVDIALLKAQIENVKSSGVRTPAQEHSMSVAQHKLDLLTGKINVQNIEDAKILFQTGDAHLTESGTGVSEQKFVYWEGPFGFMADDYYFITPTKLDLTQTPVKRAELEGFSVHRVRKWFTDSNLQAGTVVCVVGRYAGNEDLDLANGQKVRVPLLEDCYVDKKLK